MEQAFQVDLHGLVDLLSEHLYSSPRVFVRELLQNAVDAITARRASSPLHPGSIEIELIPASAAPATLIVTDDGIGLSRADAETFLATIGRSSKRDGLGKLRHEYLGQFGIGLLACFMVSDDIVVVSRSMTGGGAIEWRGRQDGTYTVRDIDADIAVGTRVYLRARSDTAEWFEPDAVLELVEHYGEHLPPRTTLRIGASSRVVAGRAFPWERPFAAGEIRERELIDDGANRLGTPVLDVLDLAAASGGVRGVGFLLGSSVSPVSRPSHRVYLKRMLLSDHVEDLLPDWAFFVRAMVDTTLLQPTASREQLFDDALLEQTRSELGSAIRDALLRMAEDDPDRLRRIVDVHFLGLKALAVHDDEFLALFADWLPVETTKGRLTLGQLRRDCPRVRFTRSHGDFQQLAQVDAAREAAVVDGGLVYDAELVSRLPGVFPGVTAEVVDATDFIAGFEQPTTQDRVAAAELMRVADAVLRPFECDVEIRRFEPTSLPGLLSTPDSVLYRRDIERSKHGASELWSSILDDLSATAPSGRAQLCFNAANPMVRRVIGLGDSAAMAAAVGILYVQSMLLGRHPVTDRELGLMGSAVTQLLDWAVAGKSGG